jgi:hypothetical protein
MKRIEEKRKARRHPLRRAAWVALGPHDLHGCKLSDVSEAGARVEVQDATPIPDQFNLLLSKNGAVRRACLVVWRNSNQLGVKFETRRAAAKRAAQVLETKVNVNPAPNRSEPAKSA